ncbi:hypothetical protein, partial [Fervidobacterium sp.]
KEVTINKATTISLQRLQKFFQTSLLPKLHHQYNFTIIYFHHYKLTVSSIKFFKNKEPSDCSPGSILSYHR